jgi:hypothetical protein
MPPVQQGYPRRQVASAHLELALVMRGPSVRTLRRPLPLPCATDMIRLGVQQADQRVLNARADDLHTIPLVNAQRSHCCRCIVIYILVVAVWYPSDENEAATSNFRKQVSLRAPLDLHYHR